MSTPKNEPGMPDGYVYTAGDCLNPKCSTFRKQGSFRRLRDSEDPRKCATCGEPERYREGDEEPQAAASAQRLVPRVAPPSAETVAVAQRIVAQHSAPGPRCEGHVYALGEDECKRCGTRAGLHAASPVADTLPAPPPTTRDEPDLRTMYMEANEIISRLSRDLIEREQQLASAVAERDAYRRDFEAELDGKGELRRRFGARDDETYVMWIERVVAERDAARASLEHVRAKIKLLGAQGGQ